MNHRYKKGDSIVQFKMYLTAAANDFNIEDLDNSVGVTFGYNEIKVVKGGKVQYTYEYDTSIRNSVYNVRDSIINYYEENSQHNSIVICDIYRLGYVLHIPKTKIDNDRNMDFWAKQARRLIVSAFMNECDCATTRRMDFSEHNSNGFKRMTDGVHGVANQLDYMIYDAPCLHLINNEWNDRISKTIDPDFLKYFTTKPTSTK